MTKRITILTRAQLRSIDGELCKIEKFNQNKPSKTLPYATLDVTCGNGQDLEIPITHKAFLSTSYDVYVCLGDMKFIYYARVGTSGHKFTRLRDAKDVI